MIDYKNFEEKFSRRFNENNIEFNNKILTDFYVFTKYLLAENEKYNLTSITDIDEIIIKHYIDSIIVLTHFDIPENAKIIDIGTGAGFPALPLSIMRKDLDITFMDSSAKKINFIKNTLQNKYIYCYGRAEEIGRNTGFRETYDFALLRAVAKLNILCEIASPFIKPGGAFIAYKSKNADSEISEAKRALKILNLKIDEIAKFEINENKRFLIKIKKLKKTPGKYPRNFSDITKNPL